MRDFKFILLILHFNKIILKINNTIEDWEEEVKSLPNFNSSQHFDKLMNHKKIFENNITNAESPFIQVSRNEIKNKED